MDSAETAELLRLAEQSGLVHAVNFNIRFYPQCQEARARVRARRDRRRPADQRRLPAGLAAARDGLELAAGPGGRRRAARGRRHRLALARPRPVRHRPAGRGRAGRPHDVHPRAPAADRPGRDVQRGRRRARPSTRRWRPRTPPASCCASSGGARGVLTVSQVSAGRKNRLQLGDRRRRERARVGLARRPRSCGSATATGPTSCSLRERRRLPARGHAEGFPDTFKRALPRGLPRGRGGRAAGRARLPDVRRRPRRGRDRRRDRALARRAAMGDRDPVPQEV